MEYKICASTDVGTVKEINQDAALVKIAATRSHGRIMFAVLCDGMGGLSYGEVASARAVKMFEDWFQMHLPSALAVTNATEKLDDHPSDKDCIDEIASEWIMLAHDANKDLIEYGECNYVKLGTTLVCAIVINNEFLIMNIGDSRAYLIDDKKVSLLTHDQSLVQDKIDKGLMSLDEAEKSSDRGVLLQCLGASGDVSPQLVRGHIDKPSSLVLCSDGFWKKMDEKELFETTRPENCKDEAHMKAGLDRLIEAVKDRGERDNITAVEIFFS